MDVDVDVEDDASPSRLNERSSDLIAVIFLSASTSIASISALTRDN